MVKSAKSEQAVRPWTERVIGARIDSLESALNAFDTRTVESLIPLRRRIGRIEAEARRAGHAAIAATAESARLAGASEVHERTVTLLALLRQVAHESRTPRTEELVRDALTGMMTCACLGRRVQQALQTGLVPPGMVALSIDQIEGVRARRGDAAVAQVIAHVGGLLRETLREHDCMARLDGERLVVFLRGEEDEGVRAAIARLQAIVGRKPLRWDDGAEELFTLRAGDLAQGVTRRGKASETRPRIAILTDSASTEKMFGLLLERAGYAVAISGRPDAEAWKALQLHRVRLVVVDTAPAQVDGVLRQIQTAYGGTRLPAILVAGQEADREVALEQGALEFLAKPILPEMLVRASERLLSRGRRGRSERAPSRPCVLVASDDLIQLIAMGSSLQKQAGFQVRLCRGAVDAIGRVREHRPSAVVLDLRLDQVRTTELLALLAEQEPSVDVLLVTEERDVRRAERITRPAIARVIVKPVSLLNLAAVVTAATGLDAIPASTEAAELLRQEILRVMDLSRSGAAT